MAYSRKRISGYIVAADRDQGRLIVDAMRAEADLNPWVAKYLTFNKNEVTGPAGKIEVVPADAGSSFGFTGNFYVLDELTHWRPGIGQKVWETISSGFGKVDPTVVVAIMNAWVKGSWQDELVIKPAFASPLWKTFYRPGNLASWMRPEVVALLRRNLPAAVAARVFDNVPIDPVVEAGYLDPADIRACQDSRVVGHSVRHPGFRYVLSVDYGPRRDRTALVVMHLDASERVVVDVLDVWQGSPEKPVQIDAVESWIERKVETFKPSAIVIDPYQMEGTCQRLEGRGRNVIRFNSRGGQGNMDLAMHLRGLVANKRLVWHPSAGRLGAETFADELTALVTKVMPYGWRLDHTAANHDDRAVAVGMGALEAVKYKFLTPGPTIGEPVNVPDSTPPIGPGHNGRNPLFGR